MIKMKYQYFFIVVGLIPITLYAVGLNVINYKFYNEVEKSCVKHGGVYSLQKPDILGFRKDNCEITRVL